jgi:S-adenosylmethionine:tRNA ribosyltransferase-isomerase
MKSTDFKYPLPKTLIAQHPKIPRDECKLMILDRKNKTIETKKFKNIIEYLDKGDCMVINDSKVFAARLFGLKEKTNAKIEVFLLRQLSLEENIWDVLVDPARKVRIGNRIFLTKNLFCEVIDNTTSRGRIVRFNYRGDFQKYIEKLGKTPLPPYVKRDSTDQDREYYQTVYAQSVGSVAAPTAGMHFTKELLRKIEKRGIRIAPVTLHIGLGTFRTVEVEDLTKHRMDSEFFYVPDSTASLVNTTVENRNKIIAVGTSVARVLEANTTAGRYIRSGQGWTDKFIYPPQTLKVVDKLVTNFHLPQSTLIMLVCAFADKDFVLKAYKKAIKEKYRFYSYGDAMLIV